MKELAPCQHTIEITYYVDLDSSYHPFQRIETEGRWVQERGATFRIAGHETKQGGEMLKSISVEILVPLDGSFEQIKELVEKTIHEELIIEV